jgi:hypothetical protein
MQTRFELWMIGAGFKETRIDPFAVAGNDVVIFQAGVMPKPD